MNEALYHLLTPHSWLVCGMERVDPSPPHPHKTIIDLTIITPKFMGQTLDVRQI